MTTWRTPTDTEWTDERTIIDPRSESPSTRPPWPRFPSLPLPSGRTTLGFVCLGIAFALVTTVAVSAHREVNVLRAALQTFEMNRVQTDSRRNDSIRAGPPGRVSLDSPPTPVLAIDDRFRAEKQATDFIVANNYDAALGQFELLLNAFPDDRVYSDFVVALRWRLRCGHRRPVGGHRCN